ncbi:MAG: DUF1801 domain-containing protein [Microcella sp.]
MSDDIVARLFDRARTLVTDATEGRSYGMRALRYRGRPLVAIAATASGYSVYPFSPAVIDAVASRNVGMAHSKGAVTATDARPLAPEAFDALVLARRAEIDAALGDR